MRGCGGCKSAFYCSKRCQKKHWNAEHRYYCFDYRRLKIQIRQNRWCHDGIWTNCNIFILSIHKKSASCYFKLDLSSFWWKMRTLMRSWATSQVPTKRYWMIFCPTMRTLPISRENGQNDGTPIISRLIHPKLFICGWISIMYKSFYNPTAMTNDKNVSHFC